MICKHCGRNCHRRIPFHKLTPNQKLLASKTCRYIWWTSRCLVWECWNRRNPCSPTGDCDKHQKGGLQYIRSISCSFTKRFDCRLEAIA